VVEARSGVKSNNAKGGGQKKKGMRDGRLKGGDEKKKNVVDDRGLKESSVFTTKEGARKRGRKTNQEKYNSKVSKKVKG